MSSSQSGRILRLEHADALRVVDILTRHLALEERSASCFLDYCERGIEDKMAFAVFGNASISLTDELYLRGPTHLFTAAENAAVVAALEEISVLRTEIANRAKLAEVTVAPGQRQRPSALAGERATVATELEL